MLRKRKAPVPAPVFEPPSKKQSKVSMNMVATGVVVHCCHHHARTARQCIQTEDPRKEFTTPLATQVLLHIIEMITMREYERARGRQLRFGSVSLQIIWQR
ncbi:hypothetical protein F4679DRAFT_588440 [Xylaria curta]|nr:hypothetical protein F4679DRAFT_588440 [Xylaria curta]